MFKFLGKIFPFHRIKKRAYATRTTPQQNRRRVGQSIFWVALATFILVAFRISWIIATNSVGGVNLSEAATSNYTFTQTIYPQRGTIYDRTGQPIAIDSSTYTIYANLDKNSVDVSGKKLYAQSSEFSALTDFLNKELKIDKTYAMQQLTRKGALQVQFGTNGTNIPLSKMNSITADAKKAGLMGIGFTATLARSYPAGNFASNFIGVAQLKSAGDSASGLIGINGIEASMNTVLTGKPGEETLEKDQYGRAIPGAIISEKPAVNGQDVYTTLDATLQHQLETQMDTFYKDSNSTQATAVLMDAHTGDILATTQRPTFNPQDMSGSKQANFTWNDLMYQLAYEPGSTMKTFLVASAMDSGKWNPNGTVVRKLDIDGTQINDWDINEYQHYLLPSVVSYADGFAMSSNTAMSQLEMSMGNPLWNSYLQRFKFGLPTRMGLGGNIEAGGSLPASDAVSQISSAFGQGIDVTQLQMLRGWTSFANQGTMLEPHFINKIVNPNANNGTGDVLQTYPEVVGKPISGTAANNITSLMQTVGTNTTYGTLNWDLYKDRGTNSGSMFTINGTPLAIKSGTAQIASPTGGYMTGINDVLNSVVAMYPPQNPDFIFYITAKIAPSYEPWQASTVADSIISQAESLKPEIENTGLALPAAKVSVANYSGKVVGPTEDILRQQTLQPVAIGDGNKITTQSISSGSKVGANTRILLLTDGAHSLPDMYDWTRAQVEQLAKWYGLTVSYKGGGDKHESGTVTSQSVSENTTMKKGDKLTVTLSD